MRIAVAHSGERISPVFDVTDNLHVVEIQGNVELRREHRALLSRNPFLRAREVKGLGVDLLICGALSHVLETALMREGVQVAGFICGDVDAVVEAFVAGGPPQGGFLMPGCCGRRRGLGMRGRGGPHRWGRK